MPSKRTKAYQQEIIYIYWGINRKTLRVESVSQQRDGVLVRFGHDGVYGTHYVMPGREAKSEVSIVFGLTDIFSAPAAMSDSESAKKQLKELEAKAETMKAEGALKG